MSTVILIRDIHRKYNNQRDELIREHTKLLESIETVHKKALAELEKKREEELSKLGAKDGNIIWEAKYYHYEKVNEGDDYSDRWTNYRIGYSKYLTDPVEAIRIKTQASGIYNKSLQLSFECVDFCDFSQVPSDRIDWIDDGELHQTYPRR